MKNLMFLLILLLLTAKSTYTQPTLEWIQRYNSPSNGNDRVQAMALDSSSNIYVSGRDAATPDGFITIKYNPEGVLQWTVRYSGMLSIVAIPVKVCIDLLGYIYVLANDVESILIKYNKDGIQQWVRRHHGPLGTGGGGASDMKLDSLSNIYIVSNERVTNYTGDLVVMKYLPNGDTSWVRSYNRVIGYGGAGGRSIALDNFGNVIAAGSQRTSNNENALTIKYSNNGVQQWVQEYNSQYDLDDRGLFVGTDTENNIYISGMSKKFPAYEQILTMKYNSSGSLQWNRFYHGGSPDSVTTINEPKDMKVDNNGNVYITGESSTPTTDYDYATLKYNTIGDLQWVQRLSSPGAHGDIPESIYLDYQGDVYVTGSFYTIKYSSTGGQMWLFHNDFMNTLFTGKRILVDKINNVYLTGDDFLSPSFDILTFKFSQFVGVKNVSKNLPENYELFQNYPNPFNPITRIRFQLPYTGITKLLIYDISGRQIIEILNKYLEVGSYEIIFDGSSLSSGTYFYKLEAGQYTQIKKMVLIK